MFCRFLDDIFVQVLKKNIFYKTIEYVNNCLNKYLLKCFSDGSVDVIFTGFCNTSPISNLKVTETVYVMNQVKTRLTPVGNIFGANVTSPGIKFVKGDQV